MKVLKKETKKHKVAIEIIEKIPNKPLSTADLLKYVKLLEIPHFKGFLCEIRYQMKFIKMKAELLTWTVPIQGYRTHWVWYSKQGQKIMCFDSYGNFRPPLKLINYIYSSNQHPVDFTYN